MSSLDVTGNEIVDRECGRVRQLQFHLLHLCREKIRKCMMEHCPGEHVDKLAQRLGLPALLADYVADRDRYNIGASD